MGVVIGPAINDPLRVHAVPARWGPQRVGEVILIDGKDVAAEAGDGLELDGGGKAPRLAVVACAVEAALPGPASAGEAVDALEDGEAAGQ